MPIPYTILLIGKDDADTIETIAARLRRPAQRMVRILRKQGVPARTIRDEERAARKIYLRSVAGTENDRGQIFEESYWTACERVMSELLDGECCS